jgi:vesicle-fusing ATPase
MFNRNNLPNPFGQRPDSTPRPSPRDGYGTPNQGVPPPQRSGMPSSYDSRMSGGYEDRNRQPPPGYGGREQPFPQSRDYPPSQRPPVGRSAPGPRMSGGGGRVWQLRPAKSPADQYTFGNLQVESCCCPFCVIKGFEANFLKSCCITPRLSDSSRRLRPLFAYQ